MSDAHGVARDQLRAFIERIERLEAEKQTIADDIKDIYGEAKSMGFDTKILRKVISIRKIDAHVRAEQEAILDSYLHALGMIQMDIFDEPEVPHDPTTGEILDDMKAKSRQRMTDGRADHKALSAAMAREGLISEEAHDENVALAEKVAEKFGNGVRSDAGLDIVTKHTEIATNEGGAKPEEELAQGSTPDLEPSGPDVNGHPNSPEEANEMDRDEMRGCNAVHSVPAEKGRKAILAGPEGVDLTHADAGESPAPSFLTKPPSPLRPHCQRPEMCAGVGRTHCHTCTKAVREQEEFA